MKKFIATFLAILMILGAMPIMAFGAEEPVIRVSSTQSNRGEDVSVNVNLENNPGIAGMTIAIDYDESVLNLTSIEKSGLAGTWIIVDNVVWANSNPLDNSYYNGVFVTLNFTVSETAALGESVVTVKYSEGDIVNCDFDDINFTVVPGSVTVVCANHSFVKEVATEDYLATKATCTDPATYYYSCECGVKGTETFKFGDPIPHNYNVEKAKPEYVKVGASCTEQALYYYSCKCGASSKDTADEGTFAAGETLPHTFDKEEASEKYFVSGATCTEKAKYYKSCSVCGEIGTEIFEYGETLPHDFVEFVDDKYLATKATCTEVATYYMSCYVCGESDTETFEHGEVLPHDFTAEVAESKYVVGEATCGEPATYYRSCSVCGESSNDESNTFANGEPLGHTWGEVEYKWAEDNSSCTATRICTIGTCGKKEVNTTNNVKVETTDATCSAEGKTVYTAEFVNDWAKTQTKTVVIEKNPEAHKWNKGEVTTEPTCSEMGVKTYTCQYNAEHTKTEDIEIDADTHALKYKTVKEPTCTEKGERKITCENDCGYEKNEEIDALDHDWGEWETVKEATTKEKGLEERECERCREKESRETEKLDNPIIPSKPSKPNPGVTDIEEDESNPNTGAAVKYGSVLGAVAIVAVVAAVAKRKK